MEIERDGDLLSIARLASNFVRERTMRRYDGLTRGLLHLRGDQLTPELSDAIRDFEDELRRRESGERLLQAVQRIAAEAEKAA